MFSWGSKQEGQVASVDEYSTQGAYGLKKCHDAEDAVADIVFIHGITGNRETTWTDKSSGVFWPEHLLKNDVHKTRILTYGYDADVAHFWAMASTNRINNHALNLANALAQLRDRTDTAARPLIFVVHSLGGLVFEDAMLSSKNSAEPHIQSLLAHTVGVCFLGTPHCGSQLANWASIFGKLFSVVKKMDTGLLEVLTPESEVLSRIQQEFHTMLRARGDKGLDVIKITCFYEELPVGGVGEIVPRHSAILPSYNSIGIHANHMDMPKFNNPQDPGYIAVSSEIIRWVRDCAQRPAPQSPPSQPGYYADSASARPPWLPPSPYGQHQQQQPPSGWRPSYYHEQPSGVSVSEESPHQQQHHPSPYQTYSPLPPSPGTRDHQPVQPQPNPHHPYQQQPPQSPPTTSSPSQPPSGPLAQQGANTVDARGMRVEGSGKVVQGNNISSGGDVTLNF